MSAGVKAFKLEMAELYEARQEEGWVPAATTKIKGTLLLDILRLTEGHRADRVYFREDGVDYLAVMKEAVDPPVGQGLTQNQK